MSSRSAVALLLALCLSACSGFGVTPASVRRGAIAQPKRPELARWDIRMGSKEDKEFEEWARKKKIASGVDPDEDFATGRQVEGSLYTVGGVIAIVVPLVAAIWAYNEGLITPQ